MHKGRAVCSAVAEIMFGRPAAAVEPIDRLRTARVFLTGGARLRKTSGIDKIRKKIRKTKNRKTKIRKASVPRNPGMTESLAPMRKIVVLAA